MNKYFFIHGKPYSGETTAQQDMVNGLETQIYNEFFNSQPSASPCLVVEVRRWRNRYYIIYSYYNDGTDYSNRPNGYCVLTLIVEGHYSICTSKMYELMDFVYTGGLRTVLKFIDEKGHYLINSFAGKEGMMASLANDVYNRLDERDFREIDETFHGPRPLNTPVQYNPKDIDSTSFYGTLRSNGKVCVTSIYPPVEQMRADYDKLSKSVDALSRENKTLTDNKQQLENKVTEIEQALSKAQIDLCKAGNVHAEEIKALEEKIRNLEEQLKQQQRNTATNQEPKTRPSWGTTTRPMGGGTTTRPSGATANNPKETNPQKEKLDSNINELASNVRSLSKEISSFRDEMSYSTHQKINPLNWIILVAVLICTAASVYNFTQTIGPSKVQNVVQQDSLMTMTQNAKQMVIDSLNNSYQQVFDALIHTKYKDNEIDLMGLRSINPFKVGNTFKLRFGQWTNNGFVEFNGGAYEIKILYGGGSIAQINDEKQITVLGEGIVVLLCSVDGKPVCTRRLDATKQ